MSGATFYQALDVAAIYEAIDGYMDRKARFLENRHRDQKATGPSHDHATVAAIGGAGPAHALLARRINPAHPNAEHMRRKLTITKQRERRGFITPAQAEQQRREVEALNHHAAARRPAP